MPIDIALCTDRNMALPTAVGIASMLRSSRQPIQFHLVIDPSADLARLLHVVLREFGGVGRIIEATPETKLGRVERGPSDVDSSATYRRLFLPDILPDLDRVIYLDADVIVRHDLTQLWQTPLAQYPLAAAPQAWAADNAAMRLRYPKGYFNSGVMLMDLARWRQCGLVRQSIAAVHQARSRLGNLFQQGDEGPLNDALQGDWLALSPRWNFTSYFTDAVAPALGIAPEELAAVRQDPGIVHFAGGYKPWLADYAELSRFHREFAALRAQIEDRVDLIGFLGPRSTACRPVVRQRQLRAMSLVHRARMLGRRRWVVVAKGTLALDVLAMAREQGLDVACVASEDPLFDGGRLQDQDVLWVPEAIRRGFDAFLIADFRSSATTAAYVADAGAVAGATLSIVG